MDVQGQIRDDQINQLEIMLLIMPPRRLCADGDDDGAGIVFSCSLFMETSCAQKSENGE